MYSVRSYGKQHDRYWNQNIQFSVSSKYSNMILSDFCYANNVVYILFENGHLISHKFTIKCLTKRANETFFFNRSSSQHYSQNRKYSKLNDGTCVVFRNQTLCWCKTNYFGYKCENKSNLLLGFKSDYNLT